MRGQNPHNHGIQMIGNSDYGTEPFVVNIEKVTRQNSNYRTALWTGQYCQVTLMNIPAGGEIGLEVHPDTDQFLRVESGTGVAVMGKNKDMLNYQSRVSDGYAIMVPAGTWHNVVNTGTRPLRLYTIYAPPHHPHGTIQRTKAEADAAEAQEN